MRNRCVIALIVIALLLSSSVFTNRATASSNYDSGIGTSLDPLSPYLSTNVVEPANSRGPDAYGYTFSVVPISWIEVSTDGTQVAFSNGENAITGPLPMGGDFSFKYFENSYTSFYVSNNGFISFESVNSRSFSPPVPDVTSPNNIIGVFLEDLLIGAPYNSGSVSYKQVTTSSGRALVIEWKNLTMVDVAGSYTFELILYESGNILFQYQNMTGPVATATVAAIEDADGLSGLVYMQNYSAPLSNKAVLYVRPPAGPRVKLMSTYQAGFAVNGKVSFPLEIRNIGDVGADTFNFTPAADFSTLFPGWTVKYFAADGYVPLIDTNGDGKVDTGPIAQGASKVVQIQMAHPPAFHDGSSSWLNLTIASSLGAKPSRITAFQAAIPAQFAQAFVDERLGVGIDLVWRSNRMTQPVTEWYSGSSLTLSPTPKGYIFFWERSGSQKTDTFTKLYTDLEYSLVDTLGHPVLNRIKLTSNRYIGEAYWEITDRWPTLASLPSGRIVVVWERFIRNYLSGETRSNLYLAILDSQGNIVVPEKMISDNVDWTPAGNLNDFPSIGITSQPSDRVTIVWSNEQVLYDAINQDLFVAQYDQLGNLVSPKTRLTNSSSSNKRYYDPSLTYLTSGRSILAYTVLDKTTDEETLEFRVLDGNAVEITAIPPQQVGYGFRPDGAQLSNGKIVLAWTAQDYQGINAAVITESGNTYSPTPPLLLTNPDQRLATSVSVTRDEAGHAVVTWLDYRWTNYLYYALLDGSANLVTPPMAFYPGMGSELLILSNYTGQGNAPYDGRYPVYLPSILLKADPIIPK